MTDKDFEREADEIIEMAVGSVPPESDDDELDRMGRMGKALRDLITLALREGYERGRAARRRAG